MAASYEIWLTTDTGVRIAQLTTGVKFSAAQAVNQAGWLNMQMPRSFDLNLIAPDRMVQIWRQPTGGVKSLWDVYFIRKWEFATNGSDEIVTIQGPGLNDLLRRRIALAYTGTAGADKTDYADDMMKAFVTEAISDATSPAPAAGTRVWANLSIAADLGLGPSITKTSQFGTLLNTSGGGLLPDISKAAKEYGTEVFFGIYPNVVGSNSITFQFRTFTGQPGADVSASVVFSQDRGNMNQPRLTYDYSDEVNYVYGGGSGEGELREIQDVFDDARYGASIWARCEAFTNATNQTGDALIATAVRDLYDGKPKINFSAAPVDTRGTRYGVHWKLGDKVTARYKNVEFMTIIRAVTISVQNGVEKVAARLELQDE